MQSADLAPSKPRASRPRGDLINRDLSDLAFIQRVLEQAEDPANPLLERAKFLSITGMLLDEFYRIRVAALRQQIRSGSKVRSHDGAMPAKQLKRADKFSNRLTRRQDRCWRDLRHGLGQAGVELIQASRIRKSEHEWLARHFERQIRPHLTASSASATEALESLKDGELFLFASLAAAEAEEPVEGVLPIPADLPRFVQLPGTEYRFIPLEEVIKLFLNELFDRGNVTFSGLARVLREGSLNRFESGDDLLALVRDAIERREHADVIRLRVERKMPEALTSTLAARLGLLQPEEIKALEKSRRRATASEFVVADTFLGLPDLVQLIDLLPGEFARNLAFPSSAPMTPDFVSMFGGDLFAAVAAADRLLHFPYDDFDLLVRFIQQAVADDAVVRISQTLYRAGSDSPIVRALAAAARRGKSVAVVVEVEAREDEKRNIELAEFLHASGVDVSYGSIDMKVHAKLLIIERREDGLTRRYLHCSTGNYHTTAGHHYTDLSLLTADPQLANEASELFGCVHAGHRPPRFERLAVAPNDMRDRVADLIIRETRSAAAGKPAAIWLKLNKLSDERLIGLLYEASEAGVDVEIIVRGICCLRAGVAGLSERIHVKSVVGRHLEHSRAFCFGNGHHLPSASAGVFISSADLMPHKLDRRVEILVPVYDEKLKERIQHDVFIPYLRDSVDSWELIADDDWVRHSGREYCVQEQLGHHGRPMR